ncbi:uncharacterized protein B0I36DRAFT_369924 [Microdochium trichocladiopsis]|uniref:Uncharacterized protein n=1 Tax=Microdochium trichocladiopsis TaxID=1682393 RepID=A0A9P8XQS9_9PEZI|nr:uncharacterized protein B0I36DRAFT_369924 [Microdochium trichocladiopsis]KAH7012101.1 hypothetical protein B0I36DRAFT_369924 [Microdochium trichocladiopsis]
MELPNEQHDGHVDMTRPGNTCLLNRLPPELRRQIGEYIFGGPELSLSQQGGRTSNFLCNLLTGCGPLSVVRHKFLDFHELFAFLASHSPNALSEIGHLVVQLSCLPDTQELEAMLTGVSNQAALNSISEQHNHILALLAHAVRLKQFVVRIDMADYFDLAGNFDASSTNALHIQGLNAIQSVVTNTLDETVDTKVDEVKHLINLPSFRLEVATCTFNEATCGLNYNETVDLRSQHGLPEGFGAHLSSHVFWTNGRIRGHFAQIASELQRRHVQHRDMEKPVLTEPGGTEDMLAAYDASGLTVSGR